MSGHSKWATIKRAKGATDAKRSTVFTRLANAVSIAARQGGGDATMNFSLRIAMDQAKNANMPKENIERAIKRGTGEGGAAVIEDIMYEAYGPGGTGMLIEAATDNRNRTSAEVKSVFNKIGGKLAAAGAVSYQFKKRGIMNFDMAGKDAEEAEMAAIEAGADDFELNDKELTVYTEVKETDKVRVAMAASGYEARDVNLSWEPNTTIKVEDEKTAMQIVKLINHLEDLDDVTTVSSNFDIADEILERIA